MTSLSLGNYTSIVKNCPTYIGQGEKMAPHLQDRQLITIVEHEIAGKQCQSKRNLIDIITSVENYGRITDALINLEPLSVAH